MPPGAVSLPASMVNVLNSEAAFKANATCSSTPGLWDYRVSPFLRSLGYGSAWIFSPLNYSSGIRKTHRHFSLPWRPRPIPPHSQTLREPEIIPRPFLSVPVPVPRDLTAQSLARAS